MSFNRNSVNNRDSLRRKSEMTPAAFDDYEGYEVIAKRMHIILPSSWFRAVWDWILILLVLYNLVSIPLEICFSYIIPVGVRAFNILVDAFFIIDLILNFRTAYYEGVGLSPIIEPRDIARHYIFGTTKKGMGWFWPDLIAAIPFDWVPASTLQQTAVLSFAKLGRLFRVGRLIKKLDHFTAARAVRVGNLLLVLLLCTHTFGCIWWKVGWDTPLDEGWQFRSITVARVLLQYDPLESEDESLLIDVVSGPPVLNGTHMRMLIEQEVSMDKQYLTSLYWALTMVMKSPWLPPSRANEQITASITVVLGAMLFAAFIGNFTTAIASYDKSNALYRDSIGTLRHFFKMRPHMSKETRKKAFRYAEAYFKQTIEGVTEHTVLASMPEHLRPTVLLELHIDLLRACTWLQETSFACCCDFLHSLRPEVLLRGDELLKAGVVSRNFYILLEGELQLTFPPEGAKLSKLSALLGEGTTHIIKSSTGARTSQRIPQGRVERKGSLVGWSPPHGLARPLAYSCKAARDSSLLSISRFRLAELLDAHPLEAGLFKRASDHASNLINPIKRRTIADGESGDDDNRCSAGGIHAGRRCSTNEMMKQAPDAENQRKSVAGGSRQSATFAGVDEREMLRGAQETGWVRGGHAGPTPAPNSGDGEGGGVSSAMAGGASALDYNPSAMGNQSGALMGMSVEDKMSVLFDEVQEMKREQAAVTAALRQLLERNGGTLNA